MGEYLGISTILVLCLLGFSANAHVFTVPGSPGSDITGAFLKTFKTACQTSAATQVVIPKGDYKLGEVTLLGPCKGPIEITVKGTVHADGNSITGKDRWITFNHISGFKLNGGGTFDGEGSASWRVNNCHKTFECKKLPISLRFDYVEDAVISNIHSVDAKNFHINVIGAKKMVFDNIKIVAPEDSPNTDGIHLGRSDGVQILNSAITTGDDCISVGDGMKNLLVKKVVCGPGHGLSVGSLGRYTYEQPVSGIRVVDSTLQDTDNGLRIKTWPSAACAYTASDISFENIILKNVSNPIIVDQEYCPHNQCNKGKPSSIKLANISFRNIKGTSDIKEVVKLLCSKSHPCTNVELEDIDIKFTGAGGPAVSQCTGVKPKLVGTMNPKACTEKVSVTSGSH